MLLSASVAAQLSNWSASGHLHNFDARLSHERHLLAMERSRRLLEDTDARHSALLELADHFRQRSDELRYSISLTDLFYSENRSIYCMYRYCTVQFTL